VGEPHKTFEPYACETYCQDAQGEWRDDVRSLKRCNRTDLEPVPWVPLARLEKSLRTLHQGRAPDRSYGPSRWKTPPEDPEGGCPGGWILARFVDSLMPYYRARTQSGNRVQNRLYDLTEDPLILSAIHYLEYQEGRAVNHQMERIAAQREE